MKNDPIVAEVRRIRHEHAARFKYDLDMIAKDIKAQEQAEVNRTARMDYAEAQFRKLCASRGLDWDTMTEAERENFVDDLIHEDRECNP
ncbi:MAG: hypothetical protein F4Y79_19110 [Gemmatimonadetes bacterium]|nr:hypothetical protein [Gemmatimonadota bacterium]